MKSCTLGDLTRAIRSKNAGPFWVTIDLFCHDENSFKQVASGISNAMVANCFAIDEALVRRFELPALQVVKFSVPRPVVQGHRLDRDMHGAQWAVLMGALSVAATPSA